MKAYLAAKEAADGRDRTFYMAVDLNLILRSAGTCTGMQRHTTTHTSNTVLK